MEILILGVENGFVTFKNKIGRTITKKIKAIKSKPYFVYGVFDKKVYFNLDTLEIIDTQKSQESQKEYSFEVEYEHKGRANNFAYKVVTVKAESYEDALNKIYKRFKNIFDIAEA